MSVFISGMALSFSLIVAIGPQNAHVLRMGLLRAHVGITVLACALTDLVLIGLGVAGLAQLGSLPAQVHGALIGAAALFLAHYGARAAGRAWRNQYAGLSAQATGMPQSRRQALAAALAFSWLNPHAWLDTAVLIGTASAAHQQPGNYLFGAGAALASAVWFVGLGLGAKKLAVRLAKPAVWRAIDVTVALTMWGTAVWLVAALR